VAGGPKRDGALRGELLGLPEREVMLDAPPAHARAHEPRGGGRADEFLVLGEVVEVRVRDERTLHGPPRIEPPVDLRQVDAGFEMLDFPGH